MNLTTPRPFHATASHECPRTRGRRRRSVSLAVAALGSLGLLTLPSTGLALEITDLGRDYTPQRTVPGLHHVPPDDEITPGNTSIRRLGVAHATWKGNNSANGQGYYRRDRDLGQVFTVPASLPEPVRVDALVLRVGMGDRAVGPIAGAPVHVQFFEVMESEEGLGIDQNGTPPGTEATHGWDLSFNRADDFVTGAVYHPLPPSDAAPLPDLPMTTRKGYNADGQVTDPEPGHLTYLRFDLAGGDEPVLQPGKRYAFLIGFAEPGHERHLGLANDTIVRDNSIYDRENPPSFVVDANGHPTWGIRREGNGALPPKMNGELHPPAPGPARDAALDDSVFADDHAMTLTPSSDGYPDVDTYRVFVFALELHAAPGVADTPAEATP